MANPRRRSRTLRYFGAGGLARRASRNKFPSDAKLHMRPKAYVATRAAQIIKGEDQASGRFINHWPGLDIAAAVAKTAIEAGFDKTAIGFDKTATAAGLDKTANRFASP